MTHYKDAHTVVEVNGRTVSIIPVPASDRDRMAALRTLFPERNGWTHFPSGIQMVVRSAEGIDTLARLVGNLAKQAAEVIQRRNA